MYSQLHLQCIPQKIYRTYMIPMAVGIYNQIYLNMIITNISQNFLTIISRINNQTMSSFLIFQDIAILLNRAYHQCFN